METPGQEEGASAGMDVFAPHSTAYISIPIPLAAPSTSAGRRKIFRHKFCIEWNILKHSVHTDTSSQPSASHFPKRVPMMYFQSISQTQFQNSAHCCYIQLLIFHHNTVYCNPIHVLLHNATFHWKSVCQQRQTRQSLFSDWSLLQNIQQHIHLVT